MEKKRRFHLDLWVLFSKGVLFGRWAVENQIGRKNLVIDDCDPRQSVYVFGCKDSVLQVKGSIFFSASFH